MELNDLENTASPAAVDRDEHVGTELLVSFERHHLAHVHGARTIAVVAFLVSRHDENRRRTANAAADLELAVLAVVRVVIATVSKRQHGRLTTRLADILSRTTRTRSTAHGFARFARESLAKERRDVALFDTLLDAASVPILLEQVEASHFVVAWCGGASVDLTTIARVSEGLEILNTRLFDAEAGASS